MARHDDGNERVEESEFHDCIEEGVRQSKRREGRSRVRVATFLVAAERLR